MVNMEPVTYDLKQTLRLIRGTLKEAFPGITFSVIQARTPYLRNCRISWSDGPSKVEVRAKIDIFQTADYNLNNDDATTHREPVEHNNQLCIFGVDFIYLFNWKKERGQTPTSTAEIVALITAYDRYRNVKEWGGYSAWAESHTAEAARLEFLLKEEKKTSRAVVKFISKLGIEKKDRKD